MSTAPSTSFPPDRPGLPAAPASALALGPVWGLAPDPVPAPGRAAPSAADGPAPAPGRAAPSAADAPSAGADGPAPDPAPAAPLAADAPLAGADGPAPDPAPAGPLAAGALLAGADGPAAPLAEAVPSGAADGPAADEAAGGGKPSSPNKLPSRAQSPRGFRGKLRAGLWPALFFYFVKILTLSGLKFDNIEKLKKRREIPSKVWYNELVRVQSTSKSGQARGRDETTWVLRTSYRCWAAWPFSCSA